MSYDPYDGGPEYPRELGTKVAKYRRMADSAGGVMAMDKRFRDQYAEAVEEAFLGLQRSALRRNLEPESRCPCASGTRHSDGKKISAAVRAQHAAQLAAYPAKVRRERTPVEWQAMYDEAMQEKRERANAVEG